MRAAGRSRRVSSSGRIRSRVRAWETNTASAARCVPTVRRHAVPAGVGPARRPGLGRRLPGGHFTLGPIDKLLPHLRGPSFVDARRWDPRSPGRGLGLRGQIGGQELAPQRGQQLAVKPAGVAGSGLRASWDGRSRRPSRAASRGEKRDRIAAHHEQPAIGLAQGVLQGMVADVAAVEKQVLHAVIAAALAGMGHVAAVRTSPSLLSTQISRSASSRPKQRGNPLQPASRWRPARIPAARCAAR